VTLDIDMTGLESTCLLHHNIPSVFHPTPQSTLSAITGTNLHGFQSWRSFDKGRRGTGRVWWLGLRFLGLRNRKTKWELPKINQTQSSLFFILNSRINVI
jgi:hypothetical protein